MKNLCISYATVCLSDESKVSDGHKNINMFVNYYEWQSKSHLFNWMCFFFQSDSFRTDLFIMERVINLNSYQPKQALYRDLSIIKGR